MNVPLGKGYGYPVLLQGIVDSQIGPIHGLKILFGRHPVTHADIDAGVGKCLHADLKLECGNKPICYLI